MTRLVIGFVSCVVGLLCVVFAGCGASSKAPKIVFKHGELRGRLAKNGLRFVVMPDSTTQLVEVDVRYEVGSREDPPGKAGLAHLVEHLMFQGRPDGPASKPLMHVIRQITLNMNAYTSWDTTHYMLNAPAEVLDAAVKVEAVRMFYGCQGVPEDEFLREREVVRNEIRGRKRSPESLIPELTLSTVYPTGHAYAHTVGGDDEQLSNITLADACEFIQKYYAPERATVIVAGGVAAETAVASIEKWFNGVERRAAAPRRQVEPFQVRGQRKTFELGLERPWVTVAWALPDAHTPEGEAASFGIWGAFFGAASKTDEYECATRSFPAVLGGDAAPVFVIALELTQMNRLDECLSFVWKAARRASNGWDRGQWTALEELKNRRKASFISSLEPLFGPGGRTDQMGDMVQFSRDVAFDSGDVYVFHELDKIGKFELASVGDAVKRALDPDRAQVTVFAPSKTGARSDRRSKVVFQTRTHDDTAPLDVDPAEARQPLRVPAELKVFGRATRFELRNGMRVVLLPVDAMPVVAGQLIFDAGEAAAPDSPLLAQAAAQFLAQPRDSTALLETGVEMECGATSDHTICAAHGMSVYLRVMIKGFERLVQAGSYDQRRIERWQRTMRAGYERRDSRQQRELERQRLAAIYGVDHPYTRSGVASAASADKIGSDALMAFRNAHYTAANATLVLTGAFDPAQAEADVRDIFEDLRVGPKDPPVARVAVQRSAPVYVGVIGDDDPQLDVEILYPSSPGIGAQHAAQLVLAEMLNEQLAAIRTRLGATYGTYARRKARTGGSAYHLGGAVDAPRAGEALRAMRDSIEVLRKGTDFDAAFVRARRKVVQELVGGSTMSTQLAAELGRIARFGLEPSYATALLRQAAALSPEQIKTLIARELDPRGEVIVVLGDRAAVTRAFTEAGIANAKLVDPADR